MPFEDCPDHGHLFKKDKSPSEKKPRLLHAIQTRGQDSDRDLDIDLIPSLSNEEIKVSQKLCSLWYELRVQDKIVYRTGKEATDEWRLVIPRDKRKKILSLLHDSKTAGHPVMSHHRFKVLLDMYEK